MKLFHSRSIFLFILLFTSFTPSIARDTITPTQPLADNETLISSGGQFALGFFTPANSERRYIGIWFNKIADHKIVWVANRASPVINSTGLLSVTANGTVMITDKKSSTIVWSVGTTSGSNVSIAQLLDNGNLVLRQDDDNNTQRYAWQSFDYPTDTLLPGMKLGLDRIRGLIRNLTSWKTETDPSEGEYCLVDTNIYLYLYSRSGKVWRSGQWDGVDLRSKGLVYSDLNNSQEVSFSFQASDQPTIFVVSRLGEVQLLTWLSDTRQWDTLWEVPGDQCDIYGQCGTYGICDIRTTPICKCLHGFVPKNPQKWASADWTNGCTRKTELDCRNGTDGFVQISGVKLPDSPISSMYSDLSLEECRLKCFNNCSCTAYAMYPGELGCMIWMTDWIFDLEQKDGFQQDLYIRTAYADLVSSTQSQKRKVKVVVILAPLLSGLVLLIICVTYFIQKTKRKRKGGTNFSNGKSNESTEDLNIPLFEFGTIEAATDYFRDENTLGQGGFGTVYKGKLANNQEIAVKRLGRTSLQGVDEFKNEVMVIAKLQNRNLVRLLGYCIQAEERILIYEYMPNKSLDFFLFGKEKGAILDWRTRYQIVIGITRGLLYLHHDSRFRIIHRDLKASNILLDKMMNPKISDFGMARLFGGDDTDFKTRKVVGT